MKQDKIIKCEDCGQEFAFTIGEQEFFAQKSLPEPKYCMICRGKYLARERDMQKYARKN